MDMGAWVHGLQPTVPRTTLRPCRRIALAMVVMTGRVTMLGLSRWAGPGGRSRTVPRFVATVIPWATLLWVFLRHHIYRSADVSLLVGDEGVATNAGKITSGLEWCCASLYGKPVPGLAFFTRALVRVQARRAVPMRVEHGVRSDAEHAASKAQAAAKKPKAPCAPRRPGRPKGSKNTPQADGTFTPEFGRMPGWLDALLHRIAGGVSWTPWGLDGHFGHHNAWRMARQSHLHLLAKLRCEAALDFPSPGPYAGRGPRRTYGHKVDDTHRPEQSRIATTGQGPLRTCVSQAQLLHKECAHPFHVVIIVPLNLHTQAQAQVILFSSDGTRAAMSLVDSDGLRCHIALNFRDAKQSWGLEDFMNVTPPDVTKAANLALCMVKGAYRLCTDVRQRVPNYRVLDLQADWRGYQYVAETIQMLPEKPEPSLFAQILHQGAGVGRMHAAQPSFSLS
jgi:DDE superfamily endonuclease